MPADTEDLIPLKILIAGGFGVGKTTLVQALSEIPPLLTEQAMTEASVERRWVFRLGGWSAVVGSVLAGLLLSDASDWQPFSLFLLLLAVAVVVGCYAALVRRYRGALS